MGGKDKAREVLSMNYKGEEIVKSYKKSYR